MDPVAARFLSDMLPVIGTAALAWGGAGAAVGALLAVGLFLLLDRRGLWGVPGGLAGVVRVLSLLLCLTLGAAGVGVATAAVGVGRGAEVALRQSKVGTEALPAYGKLGADLVALTTWWADDLADPSRPAPDPAVVAEPLRAFREQGAELPVATVQASMHTLAVALRGPQGDEVARRLAQALKGAVPPGTVTGLDQGVVQIVDAVRGKRASGPVALLEQAAARLPAVAARGGDASALSRDELGQLAAEEVMIPAVVQPFRVGLLIGVAGTEVLLAGVLAGAMLLLALFRRIFSARKVAD